jgi:sulfate adenylyltransferase
MTHPHQTPVRELYVSPDAATALQAEAEKLPAWMLDARQKGELALLMNGALAPLRGYMSEAEYSAVPDGAWPVPLALQVSADFSGRVQPGDDIALRDGGGVVAVMSVTDAWGDPVLLGGKVKGLRRPDSTAPNKVRALWRDGRIDRVLAVQPDHVQPIAGFAVDTPAGAILASLPVAPPPGPQAALWQGMVARNFGATHLMLSDAAAQDIYRPHQDRIGVRMVVPGGTF